MTTVSILTAECRAVEPPGPRRSNQATKRDKGSAATLRGDVCLCHLFVSDSAAHWSDRQKEQVRTRVEAARDFLTRRAEPYGVKIAWREHNLPDVTYPQRVPVDMFAEPGWIEQCMRLAGPASVNALVQTVRQGTPQLQVVLLVHVNKNGTSFNLSHYDGIDPSYFGERQVLFYRYPDGRPTCAATYAHEILHAFGAGELGFPFDADASRRDLAGRRYPNDIMRRVDPDLGPLQIGAYTAWRIGWTVAIEEPDRVFED